MQNKNKKKAQAEAGTSAKASSKCNNFLSNNDHNTNGDKLQQIHIPSILKLLKYASEGLLFTANRLLPQQGKVHDDR